MNLITTLTPNQVFVFGSNASGFSGAGSAGLACRGDARNNWREDPWFLAAMRAAPGSPDRVGKWAVYGVARGWQQGREGMSYAIQTIEKPGWRRSTPLKVIEDQIVELLRFCAEHPEWQFLGTPIGCGYSGYSASEMEWCWSNALWRGGGCPTNLVLPEYATEPDASTT